MSLLFVTHGSAARTFAASIRAGVGRNPLQQAGCARSEPARRVLGNRALCSMALRGDVNGRALVSTDWLARNLENVNVIDASWYLPSQNRNVRDDFMRQHIPRASFFDIEEIKDPDTDLPHMLPAAERFRSALEDLAVDADSPSVVYSSNGFVGSARAWWTFRCFGLRNVVVLDGGLQKWLAEKRPAVGAEEDASVGAKTVPAVALDSALVRTFREIVDNVDSKREIVVDARPAARFTGEQAEPRPGVESGHIPGSVCLPFSDVLAADSTMLPRGDLIQRLHQLGIEASDSPEAAVVTSCGSGVTAAIISLAMYECGIDSAVYDGSWTEYFLRGGVVARG